MAWYKTGSVTINTGETNVVGKGTRFVSNCRVGDGFRGPDGEWYELVNTASETSIGIFPPYAGPSVVDHTDYMIAPIQGYNKETADRLRYITDNIRDFSGDVEAARQSAEEAKASENAAKVSEDNAKGSENAAKASENAAKTSETNAKTSETNASQSQQASAISETNAKKSETNAKSSEDAAAVSETNAADSAEAARLSAVAAAGSELAAKTSETNAKTSETNAKGSETNAASDAATATNGATTATNAKTAAQAAQAAAEKARDDAQAAAGTVTGQLQDMGPWDASTGVYPARPVFSAFWKVTGNGSATDKGVTIEYGIGDTLMYTKTPLDEFYKIDNTEAVHSVNGQTGVVVLDKDDVGLPNVDNTSDLNKPVSTAVKTELDKRTPTVGRQDETANHIVKVGDYGLLGSNAIILDATFDANNITVQGLYLYPNFGVNIPTSYVYIRHYKYADGYVKQIAYDVASNKQWVRTQVNTNWLDWKLVGEIADNLTTDDAKVSLSAKQGKLLFDMLQANNATMVNYNYRPTAGTLVISGADLSGKSLAYVPGDNLIVTMNGIYMIQGVDFTATTGNSISFTRAIEETSEVSIVVFGSFSVTDHFTKAQSDARYYQKTETYSQAQVTSLLAAAKDDVEPGYIDGLRLSWATGTSIQVSAGSAYVQSVSKRVRYAGGSFAPITVQALNTFVHVYLKSDGTIFQSTTAPERYYNMAHRMPSDGSYRYIGSILVVSNAAGAAKFAHRLNDGFMQYMTGTRNVEDTAQRLVIAGTSAGATFTTTVCVPSTGHTLEGTWQNVNAGTVQICPTDVVSPVAQSIVVYVVASSVVNSRCSIGADRQIAYSATNGATLYAWCQGYWFDR